MRTPQAILVASVVILAPLPVGGYEAWLLPLALGLTGLALLFELCRPVSGAVGTRGGPWLVFWLAVAGYGTVQSAWFYVTRDASFYLPDAVSGLEYSVVDVGRVLTFLLRLALYGALAFTVARMGREGRDLVLLAIVVSASFQAFYGLFNHAAGNPSILGIWGPGMHADSVMGTFYSRNQLAGYLALALPLGLAWIWKRHVRAVPRSGARLLWMSSMVLYTMLLSVALLGSGSRLGLFSALVGLVVWAGLCARRNTDAVTASTARLFVWFVVILGLFSALWFGADIIAARYLLLSLDDARFAIWSIMLDMPHEVWLSGIGPGQFIDVFKLYQAPSLSGVYWRALNDPLQFILEYGLVGTAFVSIVGIWWLRRVMPESLGAIQRAAVAGIVAMLVHSLGDFDLRVPGTAVLFWVSVGIVLARDAGRIRQQMPMNSTMINKGYSKKI